MKLKYPPCSSAWVKPPKRKKDETYLLCIMHHNMQNSNRTKISKIRYHVKLSCELIKKRIAKIQYEKKKRTGKRTKNYSRKREQAYRAN